MSEQPVTGLGNNNLDILGDVAVAAIFKRQIYGIGNNYAEAAGIAAVVMVAARLSGGVWRLWRWGSLGRGGGVITKKVTTATIVM